VRHNSSTDNTHSAYQALTATQCLGKHQIGLSH